MSYVLMWENLHVTCQVHDSVLVETESWTVDHTCQSFLFFYRNIFNFEITTIKAHIVEIKHAVLQTIIRML